MANATVTIAGTAFTFVSSAPTGNQIQIGANLGATLTNAVTALNASVVPAVAAATYAQTGGNTLVITHDTLGLGGNSFTIATSTTPGSNGTVSGATLTGGANCHTFVSGTQNLPSMSIEVGLPDVPFLRLNYGARANSLSVQAQRSGLLSATVNVIAQGEAMATATAAGTPTALDVERFSQFQGSITRNGAVLGNIVSAELMYSNNLEKIEVIRSDGRIADTDPGIVKCSGNLNARFQDTSLLDQATARTPCEIAFGWTIDASRSLLFTALSACSWPARQPADPGTGRHSDAVCMAGRARSRAEQDVHRRSDERRGFLLSHVGLGSTCVRFTDPTCRSPHIAPVQRKDADRWSLKSWHRLFRQRLS